MILVNMFSSVTSLGFYCALFLLGYAIMTYGPTLLLEKIIPKIFTKLEVTVDTSSSSSASVPSPEVAMKLIKSRRSIFAKDWISSSESRVPKEYVEQMLEAANQAPTHDKTEPWHFVVFDSIASRRELGEAARDHYRENTAPEKFKKSKCQGKYDKPLQASYVIAICMKRGGVKGEAGAKKIPEIEEICSVACAVQNMHLMATALGIACYWSSGGVAYSDEMKDMCELESQDKVLGLFYVANIKDKRKIFRCSRTSIADKIDWRS